MIEDQSDGEALWAAVDVHYGDDSSARAALVLARDVGFSDVVASRTATVATTEPYVPGEFYRRELPVLRTVIPREPSLALIVVDGYVDLTPDGRGVGGARPRRIWRAGNRGGQEPVQDGHARRAGDAGPRNQAVVRDIRGTPHGAGGGHCEEHGGGVPPTGGAQARRPAGPRVAGGGRGDIRGFSHVVTQVARPLSRFWFYREFGGRKAQRPNKEAVRNSAHVWGEMTRNIAMTVGGKQALRT